MEICHLNSNRCHARTFMGLPQLVRLPHPHSHGPTMSNLQGVILTQVKPVHNYFTCQHYYTIFNQPVHYNVYQKLLLNSHQLTLSWKTKVVFGGSVTASMAQFQVTFVAYCTCLHFVNCVTFCGHQTDVTCDLSFFVCLLISIFCWL